jgi:8-oxo-dGTP diphosphatase
MVRSNPVGHARLYVVRHADAGTRSDAPDDHLRPLGPEGRRRARALVDLLATRAHGELVSSPFTRCVQTLEPLAASLRRPIAPSDALAEPADLDATLELLRRLPDCSVVCTHGDVLTRLVTELVDARQQPDLPIEFGKGVVWVVSRTESAFTLLDDVGTSVGDGSQPDRIQYAGAALSAHPPRDGQRSVTHG